MDERVAILENLANQRKSRENASLNINFKETTVEDGGSQNETNVKIHPSLECKHTLHSEEG